MHLPPENPIDWPRPKTQARTKVPTQAQLNPIDKSTADLKSQLKNHLATNIDPDLIARIEKMAASKFLLEIKEFDSVEGIAQHIRKTLSLAVLDEFAENGPSLITNWALGLLQFPALLLPLQNKQSKK